MTRAFRFCAAIVPIALAAIALHAQEPRPFVRVQLTNPAQTGVVVGEAVGVTITVFSPTFFTDAPPWPDTIEAENAIGTLDDTRAVNSTERVGGQTYAGISRDYQVYPLAAGTVTVSPITMTVRYALEGAQPSPPVTVASEPLTFVARLPPGVTGTEPFVAASAFQLTSRLNRAADNLKVGDAVTRTIAMSAEGASSRMLPPVSFPPIDGLAVYAKTPATDDKVDERSGTRLATRTDSATYTFERPGSFTLPGFSIQWWNPAVKELHTATVPAISVTVAAPALSTSAIAFEDEERAAREREAQQRAERQRLERLMAMSFAALLSVVVGVWLTRRFGGAVLRRLSAKRRSLAESEWACFRRLTRACRSGDARAVYAATLTWLNRVSEQLDGPMTLERAVGMAGDPELVRQSRALETTLFGDQRAVRAQWSGREFARVIARARPRLLEIAHGRTQSRRAPLPPLNPPAFG